MRDKKIIIELDAAAISYYMLVGPHTNSALGPGVKAVSILNLVKI
jgi:hypothetical protein